MPLSWRSRSSFTMRMHTKGMNGSTLPLTLRLFRHRTFQTWELQVNLLTLVVGRPVHPRFESPSERGTPACMARGMVRRPLERIFSLLRQADRRIWKVDAPSQASLTTFFLPTHINSGAIARA